MSRGHGSCVARCDETGSVTVHALWVSAALAVVVLVGLQIAALVQVRHAVASAADLAALAGTRAANEGRDGCAAARAMAQRNDARLSACRMDYDVATVTATGSARPWWGGTWSTAVEARAAPSWYER